MKSLYKNDLFIYDDIFPHPISGFRYEEFKTLLNYFKESKIFVEPLSYPALKTDVKIHKTHIAELIAKFPKLKNKFLQENKFVNINTKLFYCVFLTNIFHNLDWLEKYKIPFIFTLYPGGGFQVEDLISDQKLHRVLASPQFRKVIVTQLFTKEYLIKNNFCEANKIEYVFGCVVPQLSLNTNVSSEKKYPNKETFDIVFCAAKYMPKGLDKGYDVFVELAHSLTQKYDFVRFHVIGGFDKEEIDVTLLDGKIKFYGYQKFDDLAAIYQQMDVIISPNKPFLYGKGAFDGFPLGTVIEAVLNNVVAIVTDNLNQNTVFDSGKEIIITNGDVSSIENEIIDLIENPEKLIDISQKGRSKFLEIYSNDYQMNPRIKLLSEEIKIK
ncbi:glycosyltransferase family 4 protein [uncultured Flavobacterium sp.]|uniref:glycosyltransferase family 4 protein n=1 Tax=uncultured Flavobacterium sp. TaxID=165435 RepID=UPI00293041D1|nr:glycosyltransferase family 4 protein [uncultured Flavobacterium sp.]